MTLEEMIFNLIKSSVHTWVRYHLVKESQGANRTGEYIEIRTSFLSGDDLDPLFAVGFKIDRITSNKINQDAFCQILLRREVKS